MTATPKMGRVALELLPVVLVPVAFLAASPWLKTTIGGPMVSLIGAAVAIFVMGYANYFAFRRQREQDEVQKASAGFAAQWAMPAGQAAFVLLLMLPPFGDLATALVREFGGRTRRRRRPEGCRIRDDVRVRLGRVVADHRLVRRDLDLVDG